MPEARLRRMRAAYPEWNPDAWLGEMNRQYEDRFVERARLEVGDPAGPPCWCYQLPDAFESAPCPAHPSRMLRRGPVGQTN